jgi:hypothetical protein
LCFPSQDTNFVRALVVLTTAAAATTTATAVAADAIEQIRLQDLRSVE